MNNTNTLDPQTPIYRFVDMFDLFDSLEQQRLRFSKASSLIDENEGLDLLLTSLEISSGPCRNILHTEWQTNEQAIIHHKEVKDSFFTCCWALEPDSIAMWSLYSPDTTAVRIRSTVGKLEAALRDYHNVQGLYIARSTPVDQDTLVVADAYVGQVDYANLATLHKKIVARAKAFQRLKNRAEIKGEELKIDHHKMPKHYVPRKKFLLKDEAYRYERELRGIIQTGRLRLSEETYAIFQGYDDTVAPHLLPTLSKWVGEEDFPKYLFIPVPKNFIEEVCLDPRCKPYKADFIRLNIQKAGIPISASHAFGYFLNNVTF